MMLDILFLAFWVILLCFIVWYLFFAKTYQSVSKDEIALRWTIHKNNSKCNSKKIEYLQQKNDCIYGFKCGCGFEFKQKRLTHKKGLQNYPKKTKLLVSIFFLV